ncbi:Lantibiotic biosynthesis dihydropyridine synthase, TsrD family [[Actinomadura] parvosata subsp. kistnae]|uniref:lantibiotic dehydratase C-terminal domain-containing protein n=1 Tax=[Actinomadura] parvosata TaxID=1955412 RepID=UPI000D2C672D|nr:Lantibiotic biosynthesis dihydropyridine synthase, TsrD family [Actinomadura parvosata subsp. kistnae]
MTATPTHPSDAEHHRPDAAAAKPDARPRRPDAASDGARPHRPDGAPGAVPPLRSGGAPDVARLDAENRWVSAHLFHFGDLDPLITGVVDPVTRELVADGTIRRAFFLRYWEGGQHVRLRLEVPDPARQQCVRDLVRERAAAHFAGHPSPEVDPAAYRAFAAAMARGERRADYDERLHPPGTVAFIGYRPEYEAYGDAACVAAAERHFAVSSRLALDVLGAGTDMGRRTAIGLAALTMAIAACEPDLPSAAHRLATATRAFDPLPPPTLRPRMLVPPSHRRSGQCLSGPRLRRRLPGRCPASVRKWCLPAPAPAPWLRRRFPG